MIVTGTVDSDVARRILETPLPRQNIEDYGSSQDTNYVDSQDIDDEPQAEAEPKMKWVRVWNQGAGVWQSKLTSYESEAEQEPVAEPQPFNPSLPSGPNINPDEPQQGD
eukprot:SAG11_NODE_3444_length_2443_cov_3.221843_3_plen_109_part_00